MIQWMREKASMKLVEDCGPQLLAQMTKIIINGYWAGAVGEPIETIKKIRLFRRNALIPIHVSATFDIKQNTIYIYTDEGRLTRPIFYKDDAEGKFFFENTDLRKKIESVDFTWSELISGFNPKKKDVEYDTMDIIPGLHSYKDSRRCVAIMGNIAYPIEVPQADQSLGELRGLLNCGLEIHFAIGELDFQASREGLSYIPSTIASIKSKLEALNAQLAIHIANEADAIPNLWDRAVHLQRKYHNSLWTTAIKKYVQDTKLPTFDDNRYGGTMTFKMNVDDIAKKYNITVRGFNYAKHTKAYPNRKHDTEHKQKAGGGYDYIPYWGVTVETNVQFIVNDTNVGATERAKFHYRATKPDTSTVVFVLDKADKTKPMNSKAFFKAICNPPTDRIVQASSLQKKERADSGLGKNVTILCLQERGSGGYYREKEMVWRDAGKADSFDDTTTYYYLPLSGFEVQSKLGSIDVKQFYNDLKDCGLDGLKTTIYGVRKGDIEFIKTQKNWINIEDHIAKVLAKPIDNKLVMSLVMQAVDNFNLLQYNNNIVCHVTAANSPYVTLVTQFKGFEKIRYSELSLKRLCSRYAQGVTFNPEAQVQKFVDECATISKRYPLLQFLRSAPNEDVAEYVNLIDTQKGI
jgi:hypothetical protein